MDNVSNPAAPTTQTTNFKVWAFGTLASYGLIAVGAILEAFAADHPTAQWAGLLVILVGGLKASLNQSTFLKVNGERAVAMIAAESPPMMPKDR